MPSFIRSLGDVSTNLFYIQVNIQTSKESLIDMYKCQSDTQGEFCEGQTEVRELFIEMFDSIIAEINERSAFIRQQIVIRMIRNIRRLCLRFCCRARAERRDCSTTLTAFSCPPTASSIPETEGARGQVPLMATPASAIEAAFFVVRPVVFLSLVVGQALQCGRTRQEITGLRATKQWRLMSMSAWTMVKEKINDWMQQKKGKELQSVFQTLMKLLT